MTVFDNIKKIAKERGLSLQTVAERAGLSRNIIYQYKGKTNPSLETLNKIAKVLNVTADDLLGTKEKKGGNDEENLSENQKLIAYSIDPDVSDEERDAIIEMVKAAVKLRRRL